MDIAPDEAPIGLALTPPDCVTLKKLKKGHEKEQKICSCLHADEDITFRKSELKV